MSDGRKVSKRKRLKLIVKLVAPLIPILGVFAGIAYLGIAYLVYNKNVFVAFLGIWLGVLEYNLIVLYIKYVEKYSPWGSSAETRLLAIKNVQHVKIFAYILTAVGIFAGSFLLVVYWAATSGLIKVPAPLTSQEAIVTLLLLISLPLQAYVIKRETEKVTRLEMENVGFNSR